MRVLGLETSCDETAAAVVELVPGAVSARVLSDVVHSQVALHAEYGGVVPELASRDHLRHVGAVVTGALGEAGVELGGLDAIAVTCRPGLTGALLVGTQVASALSWARDLPLLGVDHLVGHLLAAQLAFPGSPPPAPPSYPFIGLLASGGHTALYRVDGPYAESIRELGGTRDDAAGEAYDKVAKLLGLGYPGGPIIDRLAAEGEPDGVELSAPMREHALLEFSFSGLKTNVARYVAGAGPIGNDQRLRDLCAAFQRRVVDTLLDKARRAALAEGVELVVLAGGVAANRELRERGQAALARSGLRLLVPERRACTDNAAMIAYAGLHRALRGEDDRGKLEISPRSALPRVTRKGGGARS
jgi:N6-L-threonylcarbamoyladenine synthase